MSLAEGSLEDDVQGGGAGGGAGGGGGKADVDDAVFGSLGGVDEDQDMTDSSELSSQINPYTPPELLPRRVLPDVRFWGTPFGGEYYQPQLIQI
jgi:hypothetical protein